MTPILEGLYLGAREDARDLHLLQQQGVTHVLNCALEVPNFHPRELCYYRMDIRDPDRGGQAGPPGDDPAGPRRRLRRHPYFTGPNSRNGFLSRFSSASGMPAKWSSTQPTTPVFSLAGTMESTSCPLPSISR